MSWKNLSDKFEPLDVMIIIAMFFLTVLIISGKNGIILGIFNTLLGALIRGLSSKENKGDK